MPKGATQKKPPAKKKSQPPRSRGVRIWRTAWHVLVILVGIVLVLFVTLVPWFFTNIITTSRYHFPDPNDGKTPISYGMKFTDVKFPSTDGITLRGWYVPAGQGAKGTIIYCHGHNRTKVEMLPMAAFGHKLGYNGLLFDLRHQGQSEGTMSSIGYLERHDAVGAARFALEKEKAQRPVVLWGISMGAAAALMAAADSPDVDGVISDSTFLSFENVIKHHWKLFFGLPTFPVADEVMYWTAHRVGFDPSEFDLEKAVGRIGPRPVLFIGVEGDKRMPPSIARTLYGEAQSELKDIEVVPGERHGEGFKSGQGKYQEAIKRFLASIAEKNARMKNLSAGKQ
jgi:pimeloyl-ACP methyl ester carboxylesterase